MPEGEIRRIRGREIAMIFQEPMTALEPVLPIGCQIAESLAEHRAMRGARGAARAIELLRSGRHTRSEAATRQLPA